MASPQELLDPRYIGQPLDVLKTVLLSDWWVALTGMAAPTPQSVLDRAACFACLPEHQLAVIQTVLLADILLGIDAGAEVTPQDILSRGACFACLPALQLDVIQTVAIAEAAAAS